MRDSFIFYRSFLEGIEELPDKDKLKVLLAIARYALNDQDAKLTGLSKMAYTLIKPQLDANKERYENGKKGGRPKSKPMVFKNEENKKTDGYVEKKPNVNVNENVNENDNENVNAKAELAPIKPSRFPTGKYQNVFLNQEETSKLSKAFGLVETQRMIEKLSEYMATHDTKYKDDGHYALICKWIREDQEKQKKENNNGGKIKQREYTDEEYLAMERKKLGII